MGQRVLLDWIEDYFKDNKDTLLSLRAEEGYLVASGIKRGKPKTLPPKEKERHQQAMRDEEARNALTWRLLQLVDKMLTLGFYHNEQRGLDRRQNLGQLMMDMLRDSQSSAGYTSSAAHKVMAF